MPAHRRPRQTVSPSSPADSSTAGPTIGASGGRGNAAIAAVVKARNKPNPSRQADPKKRGIVHFGLNKHAKDEAVVLNRANKDDGGALSIRDQGTTDAFKDGDTTYDLSTPTKAAEFTASLGVSDSQAIRLAEFLGQPSKDGFGQAKDELAGLVKALAEADTGERELKRLVLSGHKAGDSMWGDENGQVMMGQLEELIEIFPNARKGVKHLMMSACSSGDELGHLAYRGMFPNLESSTGYLGSSPGTHSGAIHHIRKWESATDEDAMKGAPDLKMVKGLRKGGNMSLWERDGGFQADAKKREAHDIEAYEHFSDNAHEAFWYGKRDATDPHERELLTIERDRARRLADRPGLESWERDNYEGKSDRIEKLLRYETSKVTYMQENRKALQAEFESLGLQLPAFDTLTRREAVTAIQAMVADVPARMDDRSPEQQRLSDLKLRLESDLL